MIKINCKNCNKEIEVFPYLLKRGQGKFCSRSCGHLGKKHSEKTRLKISLIKKGSIPWNKGGKGLQVGWSKGKKLPEEYRHKLSEAHLGQNAWNRGLKFPEKSGINHHNWKGGIVSEKRKLHTSSDWREWRTAVFKRDGYKCFDCGDNGYLEPHHIIPLKENLNNIFNINNGITLCRPCHKKTMGKESELSRTYFSFIQAPVPLYDRR